MFAVYMDKNAGIKFLSDDSNKYTITDENGLYVEYEDDAMDFDGYFTITRFGSNSKKEENVNHEYYEKKMVINEYNVNLLVIDDSTGENNQRVVAYADLQLLDPDISSKHLMLKAEMNGIGIKGSEETVKEAIKKLVSSIKGIQYIGNENSIKPSLHGKYAKLEYMTADGTSIAFNIGEDVTALYEYTRKHADEYDFSEALDTVVEPGETMNSFDVNAGLSVDVINNTESAKPFYECQLYDVWIDMKDNAEYDFKLNGVKRENITYDMISEYYREGHYYETDSTGFHWDNNFGSNSYIRFEIIDGERGENIVNMELVERWDGTGGIDYVAR